MILIELVLVVGPFVIVGVLFLLFFGIWKIPRICALGLHRFEHTHDVKHRDLELVDSCSACKCGKQRVQVYNLWGNKVKEYYPTSKEAQQE
jgi:hypothetical protein